MFIWPPCTCTKDVYGDPGSCDEGDRNAGETEEDPFLVITPRPETRTIK